MASGKGFCIETCNPKYIVKSSIMCMHLDPGQCRFHRPNATSSESGQAAEFGNDFVVDSDDEVDVEHLPVS